MTRHLLRRCAWCADKFTVYTARGEEHRFCSRTCQIEQKCCKERERRAVELAKPVRCKWCGDKFLRPRRDAKFCSTLCKRRRDKNSRRQKPGYRDEHRRSMAQWNAAHPDRPRNGTKPETQRAHWQLHRARKKAAGQTSWTGTLVMLAKVSERDGWLCGLCQEPIDPELRYPDRMSNSLDHIVPITNGGDHTEENCQPAHLACNIKKGNRHAGTARKA